MLVQSQQVVATQKTRAVFKAVTLLFIFLSCLITAAYGQEFRASISGIVTDPSGAAVAGAKVEVTDVKRQITSTATTNDAGHYSIEYLIPSTYVLAVTANGFKTYTHANFTLAINDNVGIDVTMQLGLVTESVTVSGQVSPLGTEDANRGGVIPFEMVQNLPNDGFDVINLVFLMPGALQPNYSQNGSLGLAGSQGGSLFSINGSAGGTSGRSWNNDVLVNGVTDTTQDNNISFTPAFESVQELQVKTNTYDAQYGRTGGGFATITTKAGTHDFHGVIFERYFAYALAANSYSNDRTGTPKPTSHTHNFGFETDGPIYIPKLLNARNKLFYMVSLDDTIENSPASHNSTVPLAAMRNGDFSGLLTSSGQPVTIYDPLTTKLGTDGKTYVRTPFPNNQIPASRISPFGAQILSLFPLPNLAGIGPAQTLNYVVTTPSSFPVTQWIGRLDYHVDDKDSVFFEYGQALNTQFDPSPFAADSLLNFGGVTPAGNNNYHGTLDWTRTMNATTTLNLRAGYNRTEQLRSNTLSSAFNPASLGFPQSLVSQFTQLQFPAISFGQYGGSTSSRVHDFQAEQTFIFAGVFGKQFGSHLLKIGGEARRYNNAHLMPGNASGEFTFSKNWTQANPLAADAASGNEIATMLLGYPSAASVDNNESPFFQNNYYGIFVQDDWRASKRLSLNLGLRYEYQQPISERHNRLNRGFGFNDPSPIAGQVKAAPGASACPACANLTGGILFAGSSGASKFVANQYFLDFEPRVGGAFTFNDKTVIRGGFGMYHLGEGDLPPTTGFSSTTNATTSLDGGLTPAVTMANPFPSGLVPPVGSSLGLSTLLGQAVSFNLPTFRPAVSYQVSFGLERLLPGGFMLDSSYVGNYTHGFQVSASYNFIPASQLGQPSSYYLQAVPNPFAGLLPNNSGLNGSTTPLENLMTAYPQFSAVEGNEIPIGTTRYDAWQNVATRRFRGGLSLIAGYTISKNLERLQVLNAQDFNLSDPAQSKLDHRLTAFDIPQRLTVEATWAIPVGRGARFGDGMPRPVNVVLGDWMLGMVMTQAKGFPINYPDAAPLEPGSAKLPSSKKSLLEWFNTSLFPKVAGPAPFTLQNFPSRFPDVRFMGAHNFDMSLNKSIPVYERLNLQVRGDFINLFNHPFFDSMAGQLSSGYLDVTNPSFGQLTLSQNNSPRTILLTAKLRF